MVKSAKILHGPWGDQQKVVVKQLGEEQSNVFDPTNQTKESMRVHLEKIMDNPLTSEEYYHLESKLDSLMEVVQTFEINHGVQRKVIWEENRIEYNLDNLTIPELQDIIANVDELLINTKPKYYTSLIGEYMERIIGELEENSTSSK